MKSMTAYAQVLDSIHSRRYRIEIQSLNKKGLDIQTDLPQSFLSLNIPIRLFVARFLERGTVLVRLKEEQEDKQEAGQDLIQAKQTLAHLAQAAGYPASVVTFDLLLEKATTLQSKKLEMNDIEPLLSRCIEELVKMRVEEGKQLEKDFKKRFELILHTLTEIEAHQKHAPEKLKHRLLERLKQLELSGHDEERLSKEVIYYVEKQDVTEEITRLKSHLNQMQALLTSHEAVGRKFEFLTQECFREVNTLSAKTSELAVINLTLVLKTEFEKIKEQVMNIE
jgi:uncharacterized protein (TIGR00255 family)